MTRKVYIAFCLSMVFWLFAAWGITWARTGKTVTDFVADAGLEAAGLLLGLGFFILQLGGRAGQHEGAVESRRVGLVMMAAGVFGGLTTFVLMFL